jgi:iron complex outermembrane receptor protein
MDVLRGPDASLFGANSGGVLLIAPMTIQSDSLQIKTELAFGSYKLAQRFAYLQVPLKDNTLSLGTGSQTCQCYRENSAMERLYVQIADRWYYSEDAHLNGFLFYADLKYQTPGGLTLEQWKNNPKAARPSTATLPGAVEQKARVRNKTYYGGLSNEWQINETFKNLFTIFYSSTDFENPFITNFELRNETNSGLRTSFSLENVEYKNILFKAELGAEIQKSLSRIYNYKNNNGNKDSLFVADHLNSLQYFIYGRTTLDINSRWMLDLSASFNHNRIKYYGIFPKPSMEQSIPFNDQWMPRIALSYKIAEPFVLRASISSAYSVPTIAELRASDNKVNPLLQPESAWNYEIGYRWNLRKLHLNWDVSLYHYQLQHAIVRRSNDAGEEYFVNAGGTKQTGMEHQLTFTIYPAKKIGFLYKLEAIASSSFSYYRFDDYKILDQSFSGNKLTGVPEENVVLSLNMQFAAGFEIYFQHQYVSAIPLNDANSIYSDAYNTSLVKISWSHLFSKFDIQLFSGIDNLTNANYSAGHDINAFGGRYYNPAPGRTYLLGIKIGQR